jgi:hypothetical protein
MNELKVRTRLSALLGLFRARNMSAPGEMAAILAMALREFARN